MRGWKRGRIRRVQISKQGKLLWCAESGNAHWAGLSSLIFALSARGLLAHRAGILARELFRKNDRIGELLHRPAQTAALVAHLEIRLFFGEILTALQDTLGALDRLARFELPLHVLGLGGEAGVFLLE